MKKKKPKVIVFIDGANMFYSQRDLGWIFDWKKIKKLLDKTFDVKEFNYYTPLKEKEERQKKQIERLKKFGFRVYTKAPKVIKGELKANFDVEMSIDIILKIVDGWKGEIVLLSGDSDFSYLVKVLHRRFKRKVFVFSTRRFLSWELNFLADEVYFLEDFKKEIFLKKWLLTKKAKNAIKN
jgi:uncharacterized LabA/DUF88 family protein